MIGDVAVLLVCVMVVLAVLVVGDEIAKRVMR